MNSKARIAQKREDDKKLRRQQGLAQWAELRSKRDNGDIPDMVQSPESFPVSPPIQTVHLKEGV